MDEGEGLGPTLTRTTAPRDVLRAWLKPGDRVIVAEPTDPEVLAAICELGARYVDCGRDHRLRIDAGGLALLLADRRVRLVYLPSPNWPTATVPDGALWAQARAAGVPVLADRRRAGEAWSLWRVPGQLSAELQRRCGDDGVLGSHAWTWRDTVCVRSAAGEVCVQRLGGYVVARHEA